MVDRKAKRSASLDSIEDSVDEVKEAMEPIPPAVTTNSTLVIIVALVSAMTPILLAIIALFGQEKLDNIQTNVDGRLSETIAHVRALQLQVEALGGPPAPQTLKEVLEGAPPELLRGTPVVPE